MKVRDLCLLATGATVTVGAVLLASALLNPSKAQAQASSAIPAAGGVSMVVSAGNLAATGGGNGTQGGTIVMQDSVSRKVTVVAYSFNIVNNANVTPTIFLSTNASFTY